MPFPRTSPVRSLRAATRGCRQRRRSLPEGPATWGIARNCVGTHTRAKLGTRVAVVAMPLKR